MTMIAAPILAYLLWKFGRKVSALIALLAILTSVYATKVAYDNGFIARDFDM